MLSNLHYLLPSLPPNNICYLISIIYFPLYLLWLNFGCIFTYTTIVFKNYKHIHFFIITSILILVFSNISRYINIDMYTHFHFETCRQFYNMDKQTFCINSFYVTFYSITIACSKEFIMHDALKS